MSAAMREAIGGNSPSTSVAIDNKSSEVDLLSALHRALHRTGLSQRDAAHHMNIQESYLSRALHGEKGYHVPFELLARLPLATRVELWQQLCAGDGLVATGEDASVLAAERLADAAMTFIRVKVRMARMER